MHVSSIDEIKSMISTDERYGFLKTNPHLGNNIILLTLGGSYAYGTNTETSDIDIRGIATEKASDLIGLTRFEQVVEENTDTVVYGFNKICHLLMKCNPNTVEMLGLPKEKYVYLSPLGEELLDNRKLFISKRCVESFGGFAVSQLRRIENALARDRLSQAMREKHIKESMERAVKYFKDRYTDFEYGSLVLKLVDSKRDDLDKEIVLDVHMTEFPARQFNAMLNDLKNVLDAYENFNGKSGLKNLNARNKKKDDAHLNKHAMHLVRLYLSCIDMLETGDIHTYMSDKIPMLMEIRNGKYMDEDGLYQDEFFQMVNDLEKRLQYAKRHTELPENHDTEAIQKFIMRINKEIINDF